VGVTPSTATAKVSSSDGIPSSWRVKFDERKYVQALHQAYLEKVEQSAPASPDDPTSKIFSNYAASLPSQSCVVEQSQVTVMCSFRQLLVVPFAILAVMFILAGCSSLHEHRTLHPMRHPRRYWILASCADMRTSRHRRFSRQM